MIKKFSQGFTLIELLIVISIIGILAAIITVSGSASRAQARDTERKSNVGIVSAALETYRAEHRSYPVAGDWEGVINELYPNYLDRQPEGNYRYIVGCGDLTGLYYAIDVPLEADRQTTMTSTPSDSCGDMATFVSGQYESSGTVHFRMSGR